MKRMSQLLHTLLFATLLMLTSCGNDKSMSGGATANQSLVGQCSANSVYSPVCDTNYITYDNIDIARCYGVTSTVPGNCICKYGLKVCAKSKYTGALTSQLDECDVINDRAEYGRDSIVKYAATCN